jgi:O-acetyl-ADP-ribose deacetylase
MAESYCGLKILRRYNIQQSGVRSILISKGSVLDFQSSSGAIVNAANEGCLGGGGIDGAIANAGGAKLDRARRSLPILDTNGKNEHPIVRCRTGNAVITGPARFGTIQVPYIVHAVSPNFWNVNINIGEELLALAYKRSLDVASHFDSTVGTPITQIAFSLLSAGVYKGEIPLERIFEVSVDSIHQWAVTYATDGALDEIILCAYTDEECQELTQVTDKYFSTKG